MQNTLGLDGFSNFLNFLSSTTQFLKTEIFTGGNKCAMIYGPNSGYVYYIFHTKTVFELLSVISDLMGNDISTDQNQSYFERGNAIDKTQPTHRRSSFASFSKRRSSALRKHS